MNTELDGITGFHNTLNNIEWSTETNDWFYQGGNIRSCIQLKKIKIHQQVMLSICFTIVYIKKNGENLVQYKFKISQFISAAKNLDAKSE